MMLARADNSELTVQHVHTAWTQLSSNPVVA